MSFVEVRGLRVNYGAVQAVRGISFDIPRGEVFGFIGPNGAGKSTTIKVLATLIRPDAGRVTIGGREIVRYERRIRRQIGYMPDFFGVYEDMTVREYLYFFAAAYRLPPASRRDMVGSVLELTDLTEKIDAPVDALSRGMKQRLGLARVLLHDPELILLDEPASGLDPRARIEIRELLKELRNMGKTLLISSHILSELAQLATRIGIIEAGKMVAQGSVGEVYEKLELQRIVHVQMANPSELLLSRIEALYGVLKVESEVDRVSVHIREEALAVEDLLEKILSLGGKVRMFQPQVMDMESAFMRLTEGKLS